MYFAFGGGDDPRDSLTFCLFSQYLLVHSRSSRFRYVLVRRGFPFCALSFGDSDSGMSRVRSQTWKEYIELD